MILSTTSPSIPHFKTNWNDLFGWDHWHIRKYIGVEYAYIANELYLHQSKIIISFLKTFDMHENNPNFKPMQENLHLAIKIGTPTIDATMYRSIVGGLSFLTRIRPNIQYFIN